MANRIFLAFSFLLFCWCADLQAQTTQVVYLSGTDKDHTVNWDFFINTGQKSGSWNKIAVPSNWEFKGCISIILVPMQRGARKRYLLFLKVQ
jgi:hypothetical protein